MAHRFNTGDTIHDIDGNTYIVEGDQAVLYRDGVPMAIRYDLTEGNMAECFRFREEFEALLYKLRDKA